jgi:hypothetical protein
MAINIRLEREKLLAEKKKRKRMIRIGGSQCEQLDYSNRTTGDDICHTITRSKGMSSPNRLPIRKEFIYDPVGSFHHASPFVIVFVYPKDEKPFVVKGGWRQVNHWLEIVYRKPAVIHKTCWKHGICTQHYDVINFRKDLFFAIEKTNQKYELCWHWGSTREKYCLASFKRVPRKWIKQLDIFPLQ